MKAVQFADGGKRFLAVTEKFAGKPAAVSIFEIPEECLRSASYVSGGISFFQKKKIILYRTH